jgi:hypothetical protein
MKQGVSCSNLICALYIKFFLSVYRQLLSGVGNLRVIASTLENSHRIEDRTGDFLADVDEEDDAAGPAL